MIGASVQIKGEGSGTITDIDGRYSIMNVPESATLTISYIGYKTVNISAKDKNTAKITLVEDSKMIDEVVVVGFAVFSHDFDGIGHRNTSSPSAPPNTWGEYNVPQPWGKYKWNL